MHRRRRAGASQPLLTSSTTALAQTTGAVTTTRITSPTKPTNRSASQPTTIAATGLTSSAASF